MKRVLSFSAGVDSTAILAYHLFVDSLNIDAICMADTGAERRTTYLNMKRCKKLAEKAGIPFYVVKKEGETIIEFCLRLGTLPLLPGAPRSCSRKFKSEPIERFIKTLYPNETVTFLIGIEHEEGTRLKRFTPPKQSNFKYEYPLVDLKMDRQACNALLAEHSLNNVTKSACIICPYSSLGELIDLRASKKDWQVIKQVEHTFKSTSPKKHAAWLRSGKPLNAGNRCPPGLWKHDAYKKGARLFAKSINGKRLSVDEWEAGIDARTITRTS